MTGGLPPRDSDYWITSPIAEICRPRGVVESGRMMAPADVGGRNTSITQTATKKRRSAKITPAERAQVIALIKAGVRYVEIAATVGVGQSTVETIASQEKCGPRNGGDAICAVPGCGKRLYRRNRSGVCREHRHAAGYCRCSHPSCGGVG